MTPSAIEQTVSLGFARSRTWGYVAVWTGLVLGYPLMSHGWQNGAYIAAAWATLIPVVIGLRRGAVGARAPLWLLLAGLAVGDVSTLLSRWPGGVSPQMHAAAHGIDALANVLFLAAALAVVMLRGRTDIGGIIDATIVSLAAGGLLWNLVLLPHVGAESEIGQASIFITVFVLSGVIGALTRLIKSARVHLPALFLLLGAVTLTLAANVVLVVIPAAYTVTSMMYLSAYACIGLFALDPSALRLLAPGAAPRDELSRERLFFLGAALAAVPVVAGGRALWGYPVDGLLLAVGGAAMAPLVMLRIGRLAAERTRAVEALRHEATHDSLTSVLNRREFTARLAAELGQAREVTLAFCDLDGFKAVNDRFGHAAGDRLLVEVADRLRGCVREGDLLGRFGGDEFLVLFRGAHNAHVLQERIAAAFAEPFQIADTTVVIGASIGVAISQPVWSGECAVEDLLHGADQAMYAAKRSAGLAA